MQDLKATGALLVFAQLTFDTPDHSSGLGSKCDNEIDEPMR